ncbi:MAG: hypothetical protein ACK45R_00090 [Candidatus Kapaibacterium sp.]
MISDASTCRAGRASPCSPVAMRRIIVGIAMALCLLCPALYSQSFTLLPDTLRTNVGDTLSVLCELRLGSTVSTTTPVPVEAEVVVGNYTMFYPTSLRSRTAGIDSVRIQMLRVGTYRLQFVVPAGADSIAELFLDGIALAGSDSVCTLWLQNIRVGTIPCAADSMIFISTSIDHGGTYVKPLQVSQTLPNPCYTSAELLWRVQSDTDDTLRVEIVDAVGRSIDSFLRIITTGETAVRYDHHTPQVYNGAYMAIFRSSTGVVARRFMLVE